MKRIGIFADLHCGHGAGLTHPNWHVSGANRKGKRVKKAMQEGWKGFMAALDSVLPLDAAIWNADTIDGRNRRAGGTELVTIDREEQADMASRVVQTVGAPVNIFTYGTPYHTGDLEDWENLVAREFGGDIKAHQFVNVEGLVFDVKHKVGGSVIPHGRFTAAARERLWNLEWSDREDGQPKADIIIRSHVHYHAYCGTSNWLAMTTPALQAAQTKYGARQCSGTVDFGFITFDVNSKEDWSWQSHLVPLAVVKCAATKV